MYKPIKFIQENDSIRLKIFYFTLEMSKEQKVVQAISNQLYVSTKGAVRLEPSQIRSTVHALKEEYVKKIDGLESYFNAFGKSVTFIDSIKHPTGIYKFMESYADSNGTTYTKKEKFTSKKGEVVEHEIFDYYEPNDPDEYVIIIVDHAALLTPEGGMSLHGTINKLSSEYFVKLRNRFGYIPVLIQQQASSQESLENLKADKLKPTLNGLGDCKLTQRDADVIFGLFSPYRHKRKVYPGGNGYNIQFFRDNIRFLEVVAAREGGSNNTCPLYFDGAVNYFEELPDVNDVENLERFKKLIKRIRT